MRFLFWIPNSPVARGGISVVIDVISVLNTHGIAAFALHDRPDFEYDRHAIRAPRLWSPVTRPPRETFTVRSTLRRLRDDLLGQNQAPPGNADNCPEWKFEPGDIVVVPEYVSDWMPAGLPRHVPLVLFNQGPFLLFRAFGSSGFDADRFADCVSTSEACAAADRMVLGKKSKRIPLFLSEDVYSYQETKSFQVAYMPRKRGQDARILVEALEAHADLAGVPFVAIDGVSTSEAARILRESLFFLSFSEREGFGLPAAEAMATGALVIGYSGIGGDEFFDATTGFKVPEDNLMKFYDEAVSVISGYRENKPELDEKRRHASKAILGKYNRERFETEVVRVFSEIANNTSGKS
ncbi:MAG: glycosyltransferase [Pseudomonadota bacterium]